MSFIEFKDFNFRYEENTPLLNDINLKINEGDFVLVNGPSGSGKTTLLTHLKKELIPKGTKTGSVTYNETEIEDLNDLTSACDIGYLFQNPDSQIVTDTVIQEIAFPLENIGEETEKIRNRLAEMVSFFKIKDILHKNVNELSGGQKQLVNLCSLLVLKPKVLILDEPTSQLDPIASYDFLTILRRLNEEFSITIILTDHKPDNIYPFVDKVVFLSDGKVIANDKPSKITETLFKSEDFRDYMPEVTNIYYFLKDKYLELEDYESPLSVREARKTISLLSDKLEHLEIREESPNQKDEILRCKNVYFGYTKDDVFLTDVNFTAYKGDFISVIGGNGIGKSTLLQISAGLIKPVKGKVKCDKKINISYVHQNPMVHFTKDRVSEELEGISKELLDLFELNDLVNIHPYDCSGGEQQKIAIAKALISKPEILILDEPTKGLDPISRKNLVSILKKLQEKGLTIIMASHDLSFIANYCNRCMMLFDGAIQLDTTPRFLFSNNSFYTTFTNRVIKDYIPNGVSLKDVYDKWI